MRVILLRDVYGQLSHVIEDGLPLLLPEIIVIRQQPQTITTSSSYLAPRAKDQSPSQVTGRQSQVPTSIEQDLQDFDKVLRTYLGGENGMDSDSQFAPRSDARSFDTDDVPWHSLPQGILDADVTVSGTHETFVPSGTSSDPIPRPLSSLPCPVISFAPSHPATFVPVPRPVTSFPPQRPATYFAPSRSATSSPPQRHVKSFPTTSHSVTTFPSHPLATPFSPKRPATPFLPPRLITSYPIPRPATSFPPPRPATSYPLQRPATSFHPPRPATSFSPHRPFTTFPLPPGVASGPIQCSVISFAPSSSPTALPPRRQTASFPPSRPATSFPYSHPVTVTPFPPSASMTLGHVLRPATSSPPPKRPATPSPPLRRPAKSTYVLPRPAKYFPPAKLQPKPKRPFLCTFCPYNSASLRGISVHENRAHGRSFENDTAPRCPVCFVPFPTRGRLNAHMIVHSDARPFRCPYPFCTRAFKRRGSLGVHVRAKHPGKDDRVWCTICWKEVPTSKRRHVRDKHLIPALMGSDLSHLVGEKELMDMILTKLVSDMDAEKNCFLVRNKPVLVQFVANWLQQQAQQKQQQT